MLILGLIPEDLARLRAGEGLRFECDKIGLPPMAVHIIFGETKLEIMTELGPVTGVPGPPGNGVDGPRSPA